MCPWTPDEFDGALGGVFAQDYALLAPHIDVFTPLIYANKCGRPASWARQFLEASPGFVPAGGRVQLILDVEDFPASLEETAAAEPPSWGVQIFAGASVFADREQAATFRRLSQAMRARLSR